MVPAGHGASQEFDDLALPVAVLAPDGRYVSLNAAGRAALQAVGVDTDAMVGSRWQEFFPRLLETPFASSFERLVTGDDHFVSVPLFRGSSGTYWKMELVKRRDGHILELFRPESPDDLRALYMTRLLEQFPHGAAVVYDHELRCLAAAGGGLAELGLTPDELTGASIRALREGDVPPVDETPYREAFEGKQSRVEVPFRGRVYEHWIAPVRDATGEIVAGTLLTWDVTEERRDARRLRLLHHAVDHLGDGLSIAEATPGEPLTFVNEGFLKLTGYEREEVIGRKCSFLQSEKTDPEALRRIRTAIGEGRPVRETLHNLRKDGSEFWNRLSLSPVFGDDGGLTHFVGVQEDVSRQRRLGEELEVRRRLSALGQLAGGIAHDMRNVLTGVGMLLELTLEQGSVSDPRVREDLEEAHRMLERGGAITQRLLTFARDHTLEREPLELAGFLVDRRQLLARLVKESIHVSAEVPDGPVWIEGHEGQLDQVLLNLARNAEDALPDGGNLELRLREGPPAELGLTEDVPGSASWVRLSVVDDGMGMGEAERARAFEPFFTTKEVEGGTGLGLASVHGIVSRLGGQCWIESSEGAGTSVHLAFPRIPAPERESPGATDRQRPRSDARVLLVEDDDAIRRSCRRVLQSLGCQVLSAPDGKSGMALLRAHDGAFDLVIADAVLPGTHGVDLIRAAKELRPGMPALLISGYTKREVDLARLGASFLEKPFDRSHFEGVVSELLGGAGDGPSP